jgi:hypothetical protein
MTKPSVPVTKEEKKDLYKGFKELNDMPKHTPGPWKAQGWLITADRKTNSRCGAIASISTTATMYEDKWEANAQLIAAAPDLLEACEAIANDTTHPILGNLQAMLRIAIAKATRREI